MKMLGLAVAFFLAARLGWTQDEVVDATHQWSSYTSVTLSLSGNRFETFSYAGIEWAPGETPAHYYFGQHCLDKDIPGRASICWDFEKYAGGGAFEDYQNVLAIGCSVAQLYAKWGNPPSSALASTTRISKQVCYSQADCGTDCGDGGGGSGCTPSELNNYCADLTQSDTSGGGYNPGGGSPIIIHFQNNPYRLVGFDEGVLFDITATGMPQKIGWTAADSSDALLALDRNRNGTIDDGSELFGNHTPYPNGTTASNGFNALRQYDGNGDGVLDDRDPIWRSLLLWTDRNHNGRSESDEIVPLDRSSVVVIDLQFHWSGRHDANGNQFRYQGDLLLRDGGAVRHQPVYDVFFKVQP